MFNPKNAERINIVTGQFTGAYVHLTHMWASERFPDNLSLIHI